MTHEVLSLRDIERSCWPSLSESELDRDAVTLKLLQKAYYWRAMQLDVKFCVMGCICKVHEAFGRKTFGDKGILPHAVATRPNEAAHCDFYGPLPPDGDHILVLVDPFDCYLVLVLI